MADALIKVSEPAVADKNVDTESLVGAGGATVQRERIQISGAALAEIARVLNAAPAGTEYGFVTRNIPSGTQPISAASLPLPTGAATEAGNLATLAGKDFATQTTLALIKAKTDNLDVLLSTRAAEPTTPLFIGAASTFRTPGRAGTAGQKILSLHNATGSSVTVKVTKVVVDLVQTVIKAITVAPPIVRLWKVTVLPTNGTALTPTKIGGSSTSNASVTVRGDASADGTGSGTTLTATLPAGTFVTQEFAPRFITAAGYEPADRIEFLADFDVVLGPLEGVVLFLDYTLATQNPTTDMWIAAIQWEES